MSAINIHVHTNKPMRQKALRILLAHDREVARLAEETPPDRAFTPVALDYAASA